MTTRRQFVAGLAAATTLPAVPAFAEDVFHTLKTPDLQRLQEEGDFGRIQAHSLVCRTRMYVGWYAGTPDADPVRLAQLRQELAGYYDIQLIGAEIRWRNGGLLAWREMQQRSVAGYFPALTMADGKPFRPYLRQFDRWHEAALRSDAPEQWDKPWRRWRETLERSALRA